MIESGVDFRVDLSRGVLILFQNNRVVIRKFPLKDGSDSMYLPLFTSPQAAKQFRDESQGEYTGAEIYAINNPKDGAEMLEELQVKAGVEYVHYNGSPLGIGFALTPSIPIGEVIESFRRLAR